MVSTRQTTSGRRIGYYTALWAVALIFFLPVLWIMMAAFKSNDDILSVPPKLAFSPTLDNVSRVLEESSTIPYFINSAWLALGSVVVAILVSLPAAYAFSRWKFPFTNFLMFLLLSTRMVPATAAVVPMFQMFNAFGLRGRFGMFILYTSFSIPFSVWILKGFIDGVSERFDETAIVNGAGRVHVMLKVVLPQVKPGIIAAFIFNLIFAWNEYIFNFVLGDPNTQNIPFGMSVNLLSAGGNVDWGFVAALSSMYLVLPMMMIFFFQRYLLVGMTFGTVRGDV
ncbi:MAG: multiple sugar transport system permease protein [Acidimicrobiaceae bacterium]|jgi:multiple sugar transport system permease protein|nr:MAG: multiple sugar transport system permease protein [Acidimicrobiaceae bacterium]